MDAHSILRKIPQVSQLLDSGEAAPLAARHGRDALARAIRAVLDGLRDEARAGLANLPDAAAIIARCEALLERSRQPGLRRTINATGIVLHTNLGRAPLAEAAITAASEAARGYCNLEFDLETGRRGARGGGLEAVMREVSGAKAALAVNNGAAAILLALSALAEGGEVIVSRGELVEIGGGFRVPDVIRQGGSRLVEVGSTNKTRLADYAQAITPETRVLLKVHQSNFRVLGFTAETGIDELAQLARERGLLLVADLGSGLLHRTANLREPTIAEAIGAGADIVTCSGDKLLGGPQAGLLLGSSAAVEPCRKHPLMRALRPGKMALAALEATLILHRDHAGAIPVLRMLGQGEAELAARAEHLRALVGQGEVIASTGQVGGGSLPGEELASRALALDAAAGAGAGAERLAEALRAGSPAVAGRIHEGRLLIDLLAVSDAELPELAEAILAALHRAQA